MFPIKIHRCVHLWINQESFSSTWKKITSNWLEGKKKNVGKYLWTHTLKAQGIKSIFKHIKIQPQALWGWGPLHFWAPSISVSLWQPPLSLWWPPATVNCRLPSFHPSSLNWKRQILFPGVLSKVLESRNWVSLACLGQFHFQPITVGAAGLS